MSLFSNLRHGLDAYCTDTLCLTLTYNKQTAACGYKILSPKLSPIIQQGLIRFLDLWFDRRDQKRAGRLKISQAGLELNGHPITIDDLFTELAQSNLDRCLNINSYLTPFKNLGVASLEFNYRGGGDEGGYTFSNEDSSAENFLEANYWKRWGKKIEDDDLINLEKLVDTITGGFDGEIYRDGEVFIDLIKTEIIIADRYGDKNTTICLNATDQFQSASSLAWRDMSYLIRPLSELIDIKYLILHQGLVYTATEFAIMQIISAEREVNQTALASSYNHTFAVETKQRQISSLGISAIEINQSKFAEKTALDFAFLLDDPEQITVLRISTSEINKVHGVVKIPLLVRSDVAAPPMTERGALWLHQQVEGITKGDLSSLVLLVAEIDAVKSELLIG